RGVTAADLLARGDRAAAQVVEALAAGEAHPGRRLHPGAVERRLLALDLLVAPPLELAEVELAQPLVDDRREPERRRDRPRRVERAPARARVDGVHAKRRKLRREPLGLAAARIRESNVEAAVAASARRLLGLG